MKMYVDIGNTNVKIKLDGQKIEIFATKLLTFDCFKKIMEQHQVSEVYLSSVSPLASAVINELKLFFNIHDVRTKMVAMEKKFYIDDIDELGSDLGATYFGIVDKYKKNDAIVVSLGSAYCVSVVKDGFFEGVTIYAGAASIYNNFLNKIDSSHDISYDKKRTFTFTLGKNNRNAIIEPLIVGQWSLILHAIEALQKKYNITDVYFTGCEISIYQDEIAKNHWNVIENLVIDGLETL